jgi:hypothetical protein
MDTELGWKESILAVLSATQTPMHYSEIAEQVFERGLRSVQTATPAATVSATITQSLNEGVSSPFVRVGRVIMLFVLQVRYQLWPQGLMRSKPPKSRDW